MLGLIRYWKRNKILYEILEDYKYYSDAQYDTDKNIIIQTDDSSINCVIRMNELCYLNRQNIGYAIVNDKEKGICLLIDRFEKDGKAELFPFQDGRVTIDARYKKKNQTVRFILKDEK